MRILVLTQHYSPEAFSITEICEALASHGQDVRVVTSIPCYGSKTIYSGYESKYDEVLNRVNVHRVKAYPRRNSNFSLLKNYWIYFNNSRKYLKKEACHFDVIISVCLSPISSVLYANNFAKKQKIPHLHYCLDVWPESAVATGYVHKRSLFYLFLRSLSYNFYKKTSAIAVSSPSFSEYIHDFLGLRNKKTFFIPQPPLRSDVASTGKAVSYDTPYTLVYAGNIGTLQLVDTMIEACSLIPSNIKFSFIIIGDGSLFNKAKEKATKLHLERIVHFVGRIPSGQVSAYFYNATALIMGLKKEQGFVSRTIPGKAITYLFSGKPIIASVSGDGAAVLKEAGGVLFCDDSSASFAKAIEKVFEMNLSERGEMGEQNFLYARQHFSSDSIATLFEHEILELIKEENQ